MENFDINRVHWERGKFKPWYLKQNPINLNELNLNSDEELIVIQISGERIAFLQREVVYHHIIQGKINDTDFILTFCGVCNAGVLMSPFINDKVYHFREIGVYNGQQIFEDSETLTLWNHLTGEALWGKLVGNTLNYIGSLTMSTFQEELRNNPTLKIYISGKKKLYQLIMRFVIKKILGSHNKNWLPPHFQKTLPPLNNSLPKMTMGLAVKINNTTVFYPIDSIKENVNTHTIENIVIEIRMKNKIPMAVTENGDIPFQLFTRWYAFILTYPKGKLYNIAKKD